MIKPSLQLNIATQRAMEGLLQDRMNNPTKRHPPKKKKKQTTKNYSQEVENMAPWQVLFVPKLSNHSWYALERMNDFIAPKYSAFLQM